MKAYFEIKDELIVPSSPEKSTISVFTLPDENEKTEIVEILGIDRYDLDSALDPDEISRVEFIQDRVSVILKQPITASLEQKEIGRAHV